MDSENTAIRNSPGSVPQSELFGGRIGSNRPHLSHFLQVLETIDTAQGITEGLRILLVIVTMKLKQMPQSLEDLVPSWFENGKSACTLHQSCESLTLVDLLVGFVLAMSLVGDFSIVDRTRVTRQFC